jgi:hypothetical protein
MRKLSVLLCTFAVFGLAGCADDANDQLVARTISTLSSTTSTVEQITKTLNDGVAKAKQENKPLDKNALIEATKKADDLKKIAGELQRIKADTEVVKDSITTEQKVALAKKHKQNFVQALSDLDAAQRKLDAALKDAEAVTAAEDKPVMEKLREKLTEAQQEFEVLTKRQG